MPRHESAHDSARVGTRQRGRKRAPVLLRAARSRANPGPEGARANPGPKGPGLRAKALKNSPAPRPASAGDTGQPFGVVVVGELFAFPDRPRGQDPDGVVVDV